MIGGPRSEIGGSGIAISMDRGLRIVISDIGEPGIGDWDIGSPPTVDRGWVSGRSGIMDRDMVELRFVGFGDRDIGNR